MGSEHFPVAVVGGGQAGLAAGYYLGRAGTRHVILDERNSVGDSWRRRWVSLKLFTPARIDGLPGMPFPAQSKSFPGKDAMAEYLEAYATRFELPVRNGVRVSALDASGEGYRLETSQGDVTAGQVVVATGANQTPRVPAFATELDPSIKQLSAGDYSHPSQLNAGGVLVVGAGNSGAEIALEAARDHPTWLSGRDTGSASPIFFAPPLWWFGMRVLNRATPMGRRFIARVSTGGAPVLRIRPGDLSAAGVERVARTAGVKDGRPQLDDGRVMDVNTVVWCTGFVHDFCWIHVPVFDSERRPIHDRGVVGSQPGLYFLGLPYLFGLASALIGGVGRDAEHICTMIVRHAERSS